MIGIIDIGLGNVNSVHRALSYLTISVRMVQHPDQLDEVSRIIFPGVGNYAAAVKRLKTTGLFSKIREEVLYRRKPILGICLGMQLLSEWGDEGGRTEGLSLLPGNVIKLATPQGVRLPHVGWNDISNKQMKIFSNLKADPCFYFVHSYVWQLPENQSGELKVEQCVYEGMSFIAAIQKEHVIGVQFHPEKSQKVGLSVLQNFAAGDF